MFIVNNIDMGFFLKNFISKDKIWIWIMLSILKVMRKSIYNVIFFLYDWNNWYSSYD